MTIADAIGWVCLVLGAVAIILGIITSIRNYNVQVPEPPQVTVDDQGAINDVIKNTTDFAKALKELDLGGKLLTVGVLLIAIAAISAGLDNVAEAIAEGASAS